MNNPARVAALEVLIRVEQDRAFAPLAMSSAFTGRRLDRRDRRFATELIYGVLRWRGRLDYYLQALSDKPLIRLSPVVRNALRLAVYQTDFLDSVPGPVACNESVQLTKAKEPWAAGFVNGVCRSFLRRRTSLKLPDGDQDPAYHLSVRESHPLWLVRRWLPRLGFHETARLLETNNQPAEVTLRVNCTRASVDDVAGHLAAQGVSVREGRVSPAALRLRGTGAVERLWGFKDGAFQVQDESSQLVGWVVDPPQGGRVADLCAGPGGKSTHLAQLYGERRIAPPVGGSAPIWAVDLHPHRARLVCENARRLHLTEYIETAVADVRELAVGERAGTFARVLLDAPCSGTGVLRRRPDLRWQKNEADIAALVSLQRQLLMSAGQLVQPGGALIYTTCSLEPEENLENAEWFLASYPEFEPSPLRSYIPEKGLRVLGTDRFVLDGAALQLFPHLDETDGFFLFRAVRRASGKPKCSCRKIKEKHPKTRKRETTCKGRPNEEEETDGKWAH